MSGKRKSGASKRPGTAKRLSRKPKGPPKGYMRSRFLARAYPEMIDVGGEMIVGPFCQHCGNPLSLHGADSHCPNRVLHPALPNPCCTCHGYRKDE